MSLDELAQWLDQNGEFDGSPWLKYFEKNYCSNCESIKGEVFFPGDTKPTEVEFAYCEANKLCKFFEGIGHDVDNLHMIKLWLVAEAKEEKEKLDD